MSDSTSSVHDASKKILKSAMIFKLVEGSKYILQINNTKTTTVNILKKVKSFPKGTWLLRFDKAHKNVPFAHVNVRHSLTGIKDPHAKLPPGALTAVQGGAYLAKALNWVCYATLIYDGAQLVNSVNKDIQEGTTHNTTECATKLTGQYVGGTIGCAVGATIGGFLMPGIGPIIGSMGFVVLGVKYGTDLASKLSGKMTRPLVQSEL